MKFVIIFGPQAVGKMTVGHELEKLTDLKLFHNHMTIEMVTPFFNYGTPEGKRLVKLFREEIFKAVAASDLPGLIFTYLWELDSQGDWDYIKSISEIFEEKGGEVCFVELEADVEERLVRNKTEHRLHHKPTKRNLERSEADLLGSAEKHRLNSREGEITFTNYLRINNTNLSPLEAANLIKERFCLP
jgi:hypothetical protein